VYSFFFLIFSNGQVPELVARYVAGDLPIDHFITHEFNGVDQINDAIHVLHEGQCLRAVVKY
jgi:S-(hydroxymethyl)glutathione dehydrogenase / alcohol dehydrogenase